MKNIMNKAIKVSLLSLMIGGTAMANSSLAPVGALQAGDNVTIQNELGTFPVSGSYTVLAGDQIKTGAGEIATLAIEGGHLYFSANSSATISGSDGNYTVELTSGSMGYKLRGQSTLRVAVSGEGATPVAIDGLASGAIAVDSNGSLVASPAVGNMVTVSNDGTVTTVEQGYTWVNSGLGAKLTLTQATTAATDTEEEKKKRRIAWIIAIAAALGIIIVIDNNKDDDEDEKELAAAEAAAAAALAAATAADAAAARAAADAAALAAAGAGSTPKPTPPPSVSIS
jgi:hypothetical protein